MISDTNTTIISQRVQYLNTQKNKHQAFSEGLKACCSVPPWNQRSAHLKDLAGASSLAPTAICEGKLYQPDIT